MKLNQITIQDISTLQQEVPDLIVVDVRTSDEFNQGSLIGSINIDVMDINAFKASIQKYQHQPIAVYCRSGGRSKLAAQTLKGMDFDTIYNCTNGYSSIQ